MKARPILFSPPMVRALLSGRKTQTRRVIRFPLNETHERGNPVKLYGDWALSEVGALADGVLRWKCQTDVDDYASGKTNCPYGQLGDLLWVRETFCSGTTPGPDYLYRADWSTGEEPPRCKPSIHMPHRAFRLTLRLTDVRVERVQDISNDDAIAEGIDCVWRGDNGPHEFDQVPHFRALWDSINAKRGYGWDVNPWCWCLSFNVIQANVDNVLEQQS